MPETPTEAFQLTADVVCVRDGKVLVVERRWPPHEGALALPGGYVDAGETAIAAAVRELKEETGIAVSEADLELVGFYDAPGRDPRGRFVSVVFAVTVPVGTQATAGDDAAAVRWQAPGPGLRLAFDHSQIVADAAQRLGLSRVRINLGRRDS
ncbi:NUDIX domain-containing protein [Streptomyces sp. NPDC056084]|uniref:NUDIX domain-containing protein n=1 Tax=unclassified Streptomyces TaxID=2593676 RepID=UPI0035DFFD9D